MNRYIFSILCLFSNHAALKWTDSKLINTYEHGYKAYLNESEDDAINSKIDTGLTAFNKAALGDTVGSPYSVIVKSKSGEIIAGLIGYLEICNASSEVNIGNSNSIQALWVDEKYRRQGLGTILIKKFMQYVKNQNCSVVDIWVSGYPEDVKTFFEKNGFAVMAIIPGPVEGAKYEGYPMRASLDTIDLSSLTTSKFNDVDMYAYESYFSHVIYNKNVQYIVDKYKAYIAAQFHDVKENHFTIFMTSETDEIIGGAICKTTMTPEISYCFIDELWVNDQHRSHKLGSKIMQEVEAYARKKGCTHLYLGTGAWQARPFYEKLGFTVVATLPHQKNYKEYEKYVMRKELK